MPSAPTTRTNANWTMKPSPAPTSLSWILWNNRGRKQAISSSRFTAMRFVGLESKSFLKLWPEKPAAERVIRKLRSSSQMELPLGISPPRCKFMRWRERKGLAGDCRSGPMARKARLPTLVASFMELAVQRVMQPGFYVRGQFNRLRIAEYFHGQPGLIDHHFTVFTVLKMALKFLLHRRLEFTVDIVGNLSNNAFAIQFVAPRRK